MKPASARCHHFCPSPSPFPFPSLLLRLCTARCSAPKNSRPLQPWRASTTFSSSLMRCAPQWPAHPTLTVHSQTHTLNSPPSTGTHTHTPSPDYLHTVPNTSRLQVYEKIVYDGEEHVHIGSLPDAWERTVSLGSVGKAFNTTGWKIGGLAVSFLSLSIQNTCLCLPSPH